MSKRNNHLARRGFAVLMAVVLALGGMDMQVFAEGEEYDSIVTETEKSLTDTTPTSILRTTNMEMGETDIAVLSEKHSCMENDDIEVAIAEEILLPEKTDNEYFEHSEIEEALLADYIKDTIQSKDDIFVEPIEQNPESLGEISSATDILTTYDAGENIASGIYEDIMWIIDSNGKLTVAGTGEFAPYFPRFHENQDGTTTAYRGPWFDYRDSIISAEVNVSEMTNTRFMFTHCENLKTIDFSGSDTSNVTNMSSMFSYCKSLESITFGDAFVTSKVEYMNSIVGGKMILPPHGKEFFHCAVTSFLHCMVSTFLHSSVRSFLHSCMW